MSNVAIRVEGLSKRYRIGPPEPYRALRDVLASALPFGRRPPPSVTADRRQSGHFWALKDVSFEVHEGEVLGIIGRNGAGKSTLLKILSRITRPTAGQAELRGRVGSLLEVGTGFHPELSGRENVYLNGAMLGMRKREIDRRFHEIVDFAEVAKFIDTPVKHYSSGMYVRLAFAVAAHLDRELLIVDEVLGVGDLAFQRKCLGKMDEVASGGRTVLFVSHQMNQVRRLCRRAIHLEAGRIESAGATAEVVAHYESSARAWPSGERDARDRGRSRARFVGWELRDDPSGQPHTLSVLGPVSVKFVAEVGEPLEGEHGIALHDVDGRLMWGWAADKLEISAGTSEFCYTFPVLPLRPGLYRWSVSLYDDQGLVDLWHCVPEMLIVTELHQHRRDEWNGVLNVPCTFSVDLAQ